MTHNRHLLIALLIVIIVTLVAHVLPAPRTIDDAFITFRYSRNIVEGQGFVYNPGVRTLGTTTPLYTVLMAVISLVTGGQDFPWYALTVNALASAGTAVVLLLMVRRVTESLWVGFLAGLLWAISPISVAFSVGGMETAVNIFWLVAAGYLLFVDRPIWLGIIIGFGFLTRIDSLIWIGPLMVYQLGESWWQRRTQPFFQRVPWRTWLAAILIVAPWLLFALVYFGSPVPNSLAAKSLVYNMQPGAALQTFIRAYVIPFSEFQLIGSVGVIILTPIYLTLVIIGFLYIIRYHLRLLTFVLYPWLYLATFAIMNPLVFRWYVAPPLPALILTIFIGLWAIIKQLQGLPALRDNLRISTVIMSLLAVFWISASVAGWETQPDHGPKRPAPEMAWHQQELYYREMADRLVNEYGVSSNSVVAAPDIGVIGYFTDSRIVDTVGLVMPEAAQYYPVSDSLILGDQNYAIPPQLIYDMDPAYLVTMEAAVRLGLEQEEAFSEQYRLDHIIPTDFYGTGMRLYVRRQS